MYHSWSFSDDYITIYDVNDDDGKSTVIASLTGPDLGPISFEDPYLFSLWHKKIISSTYNKMLVEFRSGEIDEGVGFSASILYSPLPNKECRNGLDMAIKRIQSPNHPDLYDNNLSCKWLISVPHGSHIILNLLQLDVRLLEILIFNLFFHFSIIFGFFLLQLEDDKDFLSIHNGGSNYSEMVARLSGQINDTKIAIPGNQMFMVFNTNEGIVRKGFNALIIERKPIKQGE